MMDIRSIKENLGRIKPAYLKNNNLRALGCATLALKELVASGIVPTMELRSLIRENMQLLTRDDAIKKHLKAPLMYQPGQERQLLAQLASVYKTMSEEAGREAWKVAFARKQKLDQNINLGISLLEQKQASEADAAFVEAIKYIKDEYAAYRIIGKALVEAGEVRRAAPYLKKGQEMLPNDTEIAALLKIVRRVKGSE